MSKYIYIYMGKTSRGEEEEDPMLHLFSFPKSCTAHAVQVHKVMWYYSLAWLYSLSFYHVHVSLLITRNYCTSTDEK